MNRLIDHALRAFLVKTYGQDLVQHVSGETDGLRFRPELPVVEFATTGLSTAASHLSKAPCEMFEDLGAWLTQIEPIRRLLRFSGRDFHDFLLRLEELPGRAHLVLPKLGVPPLVIEAQDHCVWLIMPRPVPAWQHLLTGLVRSMADDYGALCVISIEDKGIRIEICDVQFSEGRLFSLQETPALGALS